MRRVLFVSTSTTVGGAEKTLYTLATLLPPSRFKVVGVVSLKAPGRYGELLRSEGIPVDTLDWPQNGRARLRDVARLAALIRARRPDIVHAVMYQAMQLCRAVRRFGYGDFKLLTSPRVHYRTRDEVSLLVDRLLKGSDDLLVAESESTRRHLVEKLGYKPEKVLRVYNGTDLAGCTPSSADRSRLRAELGVAEHEPLLGAVGRLDPQKGHVFLIEAVAKLRAIHPVKCVLLGDGPLRSALQDKVRQLGLEDAVFLPGEKSELPRWLSALDIFVQPSLWEGLPNALLEAMALGLPVVATRVDGIPEIVRHDVTGLLCDPKSSQALITPLGDLCSDDALRRRLGTAARTLMFENFKVSDMLDNYEKAYSRILD
ncbi:MAG: glycosyltransferase [Elusimicrobiota bacterium]|jgi:glycosyltransferase involved in cell wall biosynthesis